MRRAFAILAVVLSGGLSLISAREVLAQGKPTPKPAPAPKGPKPLSETLTGDAKADYEAGKVLLGDGDFAGGAIKFQSAYDKSSDARLLWNLAICEKSERHYARTVTLVKKYLATGGDLLTADDRTEATALLNAIESFTVLLTINVNEPDAEIFVDDASVGKAPLKEPITVDIGTRKVTARKQGFREATVSQPIGGSKSATIELKLQAEVHEGEIKILSIPRAHIFIDAKEVGVGGFLGKVPSGGHTLRVVAEGMQPYQSELVVADDEKRTVEVPLAPEVDVTKLVEEKRGPVYRGFYGAFTTPFWFGSGGAYSNPNLRQESSPLISLNAKLMMGYTFGWFGLEGMAMFSFGGRIDVKYYDSTSGQFLRENYPQLGAFFGAGARVTSKHPIIRFTGAFGMGTVIRQIAKNSEDIFTYSPCENNRGTAGCPSNNGSAPSPGYSAFALAGDLGITLGGGSPTAKFFIGLDWLVEVPPDLTITAGPSIPMQYTTNGKVTIVHGPQVYFGPTIGIGFGH